MISGCHITTDGRVHLQFGTRENESTIPELSAEEISESATARRRRITTKET